MIRDRQVWAIREVDGLVATERLYSGLSVAAAIATAKRMAGGERRAAWFSRGPDYYGFVGDDATTYAIT